MATLPVTGNGIFLAGAPEQRPAVPAPRYTSRALLLSIYAIIPISLLCVLMDYAFFGGWLKVHLPRSPETLFLFLILFVQPHIMASAVTFLDRDYLKHYGRRLLPAVIVILALVIFFPALTHARGFMVFYALWTMVHSTGQQLGVTRTMGRGFNRSHTVWRWMALLIAIPIYFQIFSIVKLSHETTFRLDLAAGVALLLFLGVSCLVYRSADSRIARWYVLANVSGAVTEVAMFFLGYYFFVALISRVIHDLSAFTFYMSHDANRNANGTKNMFYRSLGFMRLPAYALCPLLAVALAFPITYYGQYDLAYRIWLPFTLFHYYTDGFVWKKGSLHRDYIRMK